MKKKSHKKVVAQLKKDIKLDKKEGMPKKAAKKRSDLKFDKVMTEFDKGKLHSGSKKGPIVENPKQAIAISYSEARKGYKKKKKK